MNDTKTKMEVANDNGYVLTNDTWGWGGRKTGSILLFMWHDEVEIRGGARYVNTLAPEDLNHHGGRDRRDMMPDIDAGLPTFAYLGYKGIDPATGRKHWFTSRAEAALLPLRVVEVLPPDHRGVRWSLLRDPITVRRIEPYRRTA